MSELSLRQEQLDADADTDRGNGRATDNSLKWYAVRYGPWAALAAYLVWLITGSLTADVKGMKLDLHDHITEQRFYSSVMCKIMAKNSGEPEGMCNLPEIVHGR